MREKSAESVFKGLKKDPSLKEQYKEAFNEIEAFLNENSPEKSREVDYPEVH